MQLTDLYDNKHEKRRLYDYKRYRRYKEKSLCPQCRKPNDRPSFTTCTSCADKKYPSRHTCTNGRYSKLITPQIRDSIISLRPTHTLHQLAAKLSISYMTVWRVCKNHNLSKTKQHTSIIE